MVWSAPYWPALWKPRAAQEEPATKTPAPRPVKARKPARAKRGRIEYEPTPEEIEAAKAAMRPRHPSEQLKPGR